MAINIEDRINALASMSARQLRVEWQRVYKSAAPDISANMLRLGIAYRMQEKAFGGLGSDTVRALRRIAKTGRANARPSIRPGTRLVRSWNGRTLVVHVGDDGFVMDGRHYRSLSEIAREVTGARWSGPRFFGLTSEKAA